jgi:hypothetical protein
MLATPTYTGRAGSISTADVLARFHWTNAHWQPANALNFPQPHITRHIDGYRVPFVLQERVDEWLAHVQSVATPAVLNPTISISPTTSYIATNDLCTLLGWDPAQLTEAQRYLWFPPTHGAHGVLRHEVQPWLERFRRVFTEREARAAGIKRRNDDV